ncbi:dodecin [Planctomycetota bacterium]
MSETYKMIEIVGTSVESLSKAIDNAIQECAKTVRGMSWFEVVEQRGRVADGKVAEFQVKLKVGFKLQRDAEG